MNRLYRSPDDKVLAGVAGGMAETYGMDPSVVRIVWALLIIFTGGVFLLLYIVMAMVVPMRPDGVQPAWDASMGWAAGPPPGAANPTGEAGTDPTSMPPGDPSMDTTAFEGATPPHQPMAPPAYGRPPRPRAEDNNAPVIIGAVLILVGALFLLRQFVDIDFGRLWPIAVIVIGLVLIVSAFGRGARRG